MSEESKRSRRQLSTEQKVAILRRHLIDRVPFSDLCDEYKLSPASSTSGSGTCLILKEYWRDEGWGTGIIVLGEQQGELAGRHLDLSGTKRSQGRPRLRDQPARGACRHMLPRRVRGTRELMSPAQGRIERRDPS